MVDVAGHAGLLALAAAADDISGALVAVDLDSRVLLWSRGAERLYGWSAQEALGCSVRELMLRGVDERADEVRSRTHAGGSWDGEFPVVHKDGTPRSWCG